METSPWERAVEEAIESAVETGREREVVPACRDEWRDGTGDGGAGREEEMPEMLRRDNRDMVGVGNPVESSIFDVRVGGCVTSEISSSLLPDDMVDGFLWPKSPSIGNKGGGAVESCSHIGDR